MIVVSLTPRRDAPGTERTQIQFPDFASFVRWLGPPKPQRVKEGQQFCPAEWPAGEATKQHEHIIGVHFGVLEYDSVPEDDLLVVLANVRTDYVFVSSWSHGDPAKDAGVELAEMQASGDRLARFKSAWGVRTKRVRGRLIMPFSRPVTRLEWPRFWPAMAEAHSHGRARPDQQARLTGMAYYMPGHAVPPHAPPIYIEQLTTGGVIDVDAILGPADAAHQRIAAAFSEVRGPEPAKFDLTRLDLRNTAKTWARSQRKNRQVLAGALRAICDGEPFAEVGNHDNMLFRVCAAIVEEWPQASPESVAALLAPSLQVMSPGESLDWALDKLKRKQAEVLREHAVAQENRVREFFSGERNTGYSAEEIKRFEAQLGATMQQRWVIQRGKTYFLFSGKPNGDGTCHGGDYDARFTAEDVVNAARVILAPAESLNIKLDVLTERGKRAKTPAELVRDYGIVAKQHVVDLSAEFSYYDNDTGQFIEAPCPMRELTPRQHPEIDRWLRLLAGKRAPQLFEWIAGVTYLDRPSSALYLEGTSGAGKTLLACGLARLWTKLGPTALEDCFGSFNAGILKCPLVFGDEVAPKDFQGKVRTGEIREFIQAKQRPLRRKYVDCDTVRGAVRLVFAANNTELLSSNEHLTVNDIAAITERFLHLPVSEEAAAHLRDVRSRSGRSLEAWVEQDMIAEHALYLRETIPVRDDVRLLASGDASALATSLTIGTGIRSAVLHWLVLYLLDPSKLAQNSANSLIRMHKGRLAVNARIFAEAWDVYRTNTSAPTAGRIAQAVAGLAAGPRVHLRDRNGQETWYREIATENLVAWAEDNGYASGDTIKAILARMDARPAGAPPPNGTVN